MKNDLTGQRFGQLTVTSEARLRTDLGQAIRAWNVTCDCGTEKVVRQRNLVSGRTQTCGQHRRNRLNDTITYAGAHARVVRARGKAVEHCCVQCGFRAHHWSYNGTDPDEQTQLRGGYVLRYSPDPDQYEPRCRTCHRAHDWLLRHAPDALAEMGREEVEVCTP